jgi:type IV secretion system protein VirB4
MDDALAVISASTDNIEIMHDVLHNRAAAEGMLANDLRPEQWLQAFYENRKGSGKSRPNSPSASSTTRTATG